MSFIDNDEPNTALSIASLLNDSDPHLQFDLSKVKQMISFLEDKGENYPFFDLPSAIIPEDIRPKHPEWVGSIETSVSYYQDRGVISFTISCRDHWGESVKDAPTVHEIFPLDKEIVRRLENYFYLLCLKNCDDAFNLMEEYERHKRKQVFLDKRLEEIDPDWKRTS